MKHLLASLLLLAAIVAAKPARADLPVKKVLTLDVAMKIADAAKAEALKRGSTVVIVVVDDGGYPIVLHRLDNTQVASVEVGIGKAPLRDISPRTRDEGLKHLRSFGIDLILLSTTSKPPASSRKSHQRITSGSFPIPALGFPP